MGPLAFVITILGCADGGTACAPVRTLPTAYVSREACAMAQANALQTNADLEFPVIQAECRRMTPQMARHDEGTTG